MEPQDFAKKDREGSGFSKRRLSSILKGPRKSARFPDPEQQENVVESAKPVEKRISRRVSFAAANDVLLFSKDVKNPSPARSPLQELMTAAGATAQNRVQVVVAEDGIPQTRALETLLNAPLHASQQDKVSLDTVEGFGEKTVMFSTDDAFMDMTHSQTMNVSSYADTSLAVCDALPAGEEKKWMFTADDASMDVSLLPARKKDLSVEKRDIPSSVSSLDHGFENFLASLSKPGGPSSLATVDTNISVAQVKTRKANVDKENLLPASISAVMESLNKPRKAEESSCGLGPDVDVSMNLTEVQTGRVLSVAVDDNPFQCLFPTQDMYALSDEGESQTAKVTMIKSEPKVMASSKNAGRNASQPRRKVNLNARDENTDKTIRFTAGDEFMDMTQSHTVNISRGPLAPQPVSADGLESGFKNFLTGLSKTTVPSVNTGIERVSPLTAASSQKTINMDRPLYELKTPMPDASKENWSLNPSRSCRESSMGGEICPDNDMTMEMTENQTGRILEVSGSNDPFQFLFPSQDIYPHGENLKKAEKTSGQKNSEALGSLKHAGLHTQDEFVPEDDHREKTVRFSADDACMDVTRSHTVHIGTDFSHKHSGSLSSKDKTIRFNVKDAGMDMTQCLTVNIANNLGSDSILLSEKKPEIEKRGPLRDRPSSAHGLDPNSFLTSVDPVFERKTLTAAPFSYVRDSSAGGTICPEDDVSMDMDMTEAQTGRIVGLTHTDDPLQGPFPPQDLFPQSGYLKKADMTSGRKSSGALGSSGRTGMGTSWKSSLKTKEQKPQDELDPEDDHREKTVRFSADDACMDVTRSHTVHIGTDFSHKHSGSLSSKDKTIRFNVKDAGMDMTQCLTVNIANNLGSDSILLSEKKPESEKRGPLRDRSSSAHGLDPESNSFLTSVDPVFERKTLTAAPFSYVRDSSAGGTICPEDDVSMDMDMTEAQTGRIVGLTHTDDPLQGPFPPQDFFPQSGYLKKAEMTSGRKSSGALGSSGRTGMGTSWKSSLKTKEQKPQDELDPEDDHREKTVRFSADDACMDVTRSHTVHIGTDFSHKHSGSLSSKDKTIRFNVKDAGMDMTQCLTVNIANNLGSDSILLSEKEPEIEKRGPLRDRSSSAHGLDPNSFLTRVDPVFERNTLTAAPFSNVRDSSAGGTICPEDDVSMDMDMTEAQTGRIVGLTHTDDPLQGPFPPQDLFPQSGYLKKAEMTSGRKSSGALGSSGRTGVDKSSRTSFKTTMQRSQVKFDAEDDCRGESVRSSPDDADTNGTDCLDVDVVTRTASHSVLPHQETNITESHRDTDLHLIGNKRGRSLSTRSLDPGFQNSLSRMSCPWVNPVKVVTPAGQRPPEAADASDHLQIQNPGVDTTNDALEKSQNKTLTDFTEIDQSMEMTEAQTGRIFGKSCTDELPQCLTSSQDSDLKCELSKQTEAKSQQSDKAVEISNLTESADSFKIVTRKEPKPRNETTSSQKMDDGSSPSAVDQDLDLFGSRKSRRISLADIHSKVKRLSHMINTAPGAFLVESCTETLPHFDDGLDENKPLPAAEPELDMSLESKEEKTQNQYLTRGAESPAAATPFNLKTKHLMSRLSMGGFKAKLPQLSKPSDPKVLNWAGEHTKNMTVNVTNQLSSIDHDVSDIFDEQLDSSEDVSDTLKPKSPEEIPEKITSHQQEAEIELLEEDVFEEDFISAVQGKKRPLPNDENNMEDEKRMKASTEEAEDINDMESQSHFVEYDGNLTSAPTMTTHTTDCSSSSSHTASGRCEATFESTFKHSMYESQLEDYTSDAQKKLADGTITVLEFLKLFNIDFVIHNSRQSVLPGRILSDTERTEIDVLREKHICRPKQTVYETDVLSLTEKVEGLKVRLQDLDKPLKTMNQALWDEMRNSSEKELKSFGLKLKEKNSFFRKTSKVLGHEMKELLYSNLVQADQEEQQKLRGTIEQADEMIKSLDDCICEMEAELAAVEEKGFGGKPGLRSRQEEMKNVSEALADNDRQMAELELQKKQNSSKLNRLQTDTRNLESHISAMHLVNEWKLGEKQENCSIYTFLHETMHLQLVYEKSEGTDADHQTERKISHINFKLQLNDEKSRCHARLVHQLLSHYVDREASWVEKYPTSRHVPTLLHDVGLVVSRCRLLGEELRLLKMWGGLQLDILDISCEDTRVHIVFSSLKTLSKFKVVFSVGLIEQLCVVQVESFNNVIGGTGRQQIEEVVASFIPSKNLLTKIIKKIHNHLLC
ncbi:uncharacterized protein knl1 [Pleuronectes platessa]|uniref:uncharacterized protein knl1 n=1 Tax=Pleuronectes platessa TaxID=8262 RepID=UPI00232A6969|nr:uncharacterized protein knl1 [Pleuronectes platessa]